MPRNSGKASRRWISRPRSGQGRNVSGSGQWRPRRIEPRGPRRPEEHHQLIDDRAAAVELHGQVELLLLDRGEEARDLADRRLALGQARITRELAEPVEVTIETVDEGPRPGQPDQHDLGPRPGGAERAQGRHRAEHVPELQRTEDDDPTGRRQSPLRDGRMARSCASSSLRSRHAGRRAGTIDARTECTASTQRNARRSPNPSRFTRCAARFRALEPRLPIEGGPAFRKCRGARARRPRPRVVASSTSPLRRHGRKVRVFAAILIPSSAERQPITTCDEAVLLEIRT